MRTLTINNIGKEKIFLLFVLLESLGIICSIFLSYKIVFVLFLASALFLLSFWDIKIGLLLAVAFSTLIKYGAKEKSLFGIATTQLEMGILTLILIFFLLAIYAKSCLEGLEIKRSKLDLPLILIISISLLAAIRGILIRGIGLYNVALVGEELYPFLGFGIIFLVINLFDSPITIRRFFYVLILIALYSAFIGLIAYFKAGHRLSGRLFNPFPSMIALVLLNLTFYVKNRRSKFLYVIISIPLIFHLICSFTRGYWIGFLGGLTISYAIFTWQNKGSWTRRTFVFTKGFLLIGAVICILLLIVSIFFSTQDLPFQVWRRLGSSFRPVPFSSDLARLVEYKACLEKIKKNPILGYGFGYALEYKDPMFPMLHSQWYIHQSYLYITLKMGLLGLMAFLWFFYVFLKETIRNCTKIQDNFFRGLAFGFIGNVFQLLLTGLTNYEFATVVNTFYLYFAMGAVMVIGQKLSNHPEYIKN